MDNLCGLDWYDFMWCYGMYKLANSDEGGGESIPPLTGDNNERR